MQSSMGREMHSTCHRQMAIPVPFACIRVLRGKSQNVYCYFMHLVVKQKRYVYAIVQQSVMSLNGFDGRRNEATGV